MSENFGFTKEEVISEIDRLNSTKYQALIPKIGGNPDRYLNEIVHPLVSDLLEANNKKITEDIKKYLIRYNEKS